MNCPACNAPLFGGSVCGCGYARKRRLSSIDLSYIEALAAYWRIYWPTQLFGIIGYLPFDVWIRVPGGGYNLRANGMSTTEQFFLQAVLGAIGLFLFVHRVFSSSFKRFSIRILTDPSGETVTKLSLRQRSKIWFFLWWRQIVAGILAAILAAPLNVLLSLIGLRTVLGINVAYWISTLGVVLAVGPIILKMLISNQFSDFRFEVKRFSFVSETTTAPESSC